MIDRGESSVQHFNAAKREIDANFPVGRFVAVENNQVVAEANSHRELVASLQELGKSPKDMLVVQAGVEYPDSAVIFLDLHAQRCHA